MHGGLPTSVLPTKPLSRSNDPTNTTGQQATRYFIPVVCSGATLDELMTADQVAALLLLPASTVKDYARRGVLPSIKLGKHRRFVRSAIQVALDDLARRR